MRILLLGTLVLCGFMVGDSLTAELEVIAFEATSVKLNDVYDRMTGTYFVPYSPETSPPAQIGDTDARDFPLTAIVDSGVLSHHPIIKKSLRASADFTGEGPEDLYGHGTIVALVYLRTVPTRAPILNAKALRRTGTGTPHSLTSAIDWSAKNGAKVINVSAGVFPGCRSVREIGQETTSEAESCEQTPICETVSKVTKEGSHVVAAVGNRPGRIACPACCRDAIAVGASMGEMVAPYSGSYPDVIAPGTIYMVPLK